MTVLRASTLADCDALDEIPVEDAHVTARLFIGRRGSPDRVNRGFGAVRFAPLEFLSHVDPEFRELSPDARDTSRQGLQFTHLLLEHLDPPCQRCARPHVEDGSIVKGASQATVVLVV